MSILSHVGIVLVVIWWLSYMDKCHPAFYFFSFISLYLIHERYVMRLRRKLQFEERKQANQRRVLTDSETVRWLNYAIEKIWLMCMEPIASQNILMPIIPWFLEKYKPWTARKAEVQHLYLGRNPPVFTEMRVLPQSTDDDHLVLELGMDFLTADDMSAILSVKMRKRVGFGMRAKMHLTGMHVEGKILVGVKFLRHWPFVSRVRVCFAEPPYVQMTVKPIFSHGIDVTELPGIAGWLDKLLSIAFEQTLVEPNMLVVDMEKYVSPQAESWFSVDVKEPIAYAKVEVIEATDLKPSDLNGLADPYVKGQLGPYRFRTKIQRKTRTPIWQEEYKIPICTWDSRNVLYIEVLDKDRFVDDTLGVCSLEINDLKDGQRHNMWLPLKNIKIGRLHLAITVFKLKKKGGDTVLDGESFHKGDTSDSFASETCNKDSFSSETSSNSQKVADDFEPVDVEGQKETGIWIHRPGSEVLPTWEPRKGSRRLDAEIWGERDDSFGSSNLVSGSSNNGGSNNEEKLVLPKPMHTVRKGLHKIGSVFHRSPRKDDYSDSVVEAYNSRHANIRATNSRETGVKLIVINNLAQPAAAKEAKFISPETDGPESPKKMKNEAKSFLKNAEKSARSIKHVLSRKGAQKYHDNASATTERTIVAESDSSDDESSTPSSNDILFVGNSECSPKEHCVQTEGGHNVTLVDSKAPEDVRESAPSIDAEVVPMETVKVVQTDSIQNVPPVDSVGPADQSLNKPAESTITAEDMTTQMSETRPANIPAEKM